MAQQIPGVQARKAKNMELNTISADIVDAALAIHRELGPGLLESAYENVLAAELRRRGHEVFTQVPISFNFRGLEIKNAFRIDLLVDRDIVVELKSTEATSPVFAKQLKTYLVLANRKLGLLLNFGQAYMKDGIKRIVNGDIPDLKQHPKQNVSYSRNGPSAPCLRGSV